MNILLISQCDKRALTETRRILDQFAERRGDLTIERLRVRDPHAAGCSLVVAPAPTPTRRPGSRVRTRRGVEQA